MEVGDAAGADVSPKRTIRAIRPEEVQRREVGRPGLVLDGKYRLDRRIAAGGVASIWAATHTTLARPIAVKFVETPAGSGESEEELIARFLQEARVAGSVRHKHVVDILDFGVHRADGRAEPYMVMELLEGEALDERLEHGRLELRDVVRITRQVLRGLDAVHEAGIVHRDMKPGNVFLTEDADGYFARVLDFGISVGEDAGTDGNVVGTPEYMSPEQAWGEVLDRRSDLYSVGVILYEMLSGHTPFEHPDPLVVIQRVVSEVPRPLVELRPDVPELCAVVDRALARAPSERFASAREMHDALRAAAKASAIDAGKADSGDHGRPSERFDAVSPVPETPPAKVPWSRAAMLRPIAGVAAALLGVAIALWVASEPTLPRADASTPVLPVTSPPVIAPAVPPPAPPTSAPAPVATATPAPTAEPAAAAPDTLATAEPAAPEAEEPAAPAETVPPADDVAAVDTDPTEGPSTEPETVAAAEPAPPPEPPSDEHLRPAAFEPERTPARERRPSPSRSRTPHRRAPIAGDITHELDF